MRVRDLNGEPIDAPREWTPGYLELDELDPDAWERARVTVNGETLPVSLRRLKGRRRVLAEWPRLGAGRYRVRIDGVGDRASAEHQLELTPAKFADGEFDTLVADLQARLPLSIVLALHRGGAPLAGVETEALQERSWENELELLRRVLDGVTGRPGLPELLRRIAHDPHKALDTVDRPVRTERARRPSVAALRRALRTSREALDDDGLPLTLDDRRVVVSYDTAENRLVRGVCDLVRRRLGRLQSVGSRLGAEAQDELAALLDRHARAQRPAAFLAEVSAQRQPPVQPSMVMMRDSRYRAVHAIWRELTRQLLVTFDEPGLEAPLDNVPRLYERWAALVAVEALLAAAAEAGWQVVEQRLVERRPDGIYARLLRDGAPVLRLRDPVTQATARLVPQRSFHPDAGALRSTSLTQRPDLTLEVRDANGGMRLLVLDPKYKLDGEIGDEASVTPKKTDIDKMHAYRDAIVDARDGRRVVAFAATIYPGPDVAYDTVAALQGRPGRADVLVARLEDWSVEHLAARAF
jgi:hypothetical protein